MADDIAAVKEMVMNREIVAALKADAMLPALDTP
jgi:hypothetical protein